MQLLPVLDRELAPATGGSISHSPENPNASSGGKATRKLRFRTIKSSNYDVNNTCNLTCEGCYYFVSGQKTANARPKPKDYDSFFAAEAARGVNYPIFSGGEPSMNPTALKAAAKYWNSGLIYTNGIKTVPSEVPFRIAISVWGNRARTALLRGKDTYDRALEVAEGDPRALIYFTITRHNIDDIQEVVDDCLARNLTISFNDFSMTTEYRNRLAGDNLQPNPYFRISTSEDNLSLREEDRLKAAIILDRLIAQFPDSVLFSRVLNDWMHRSKAIHQIDPKTGIATDCAILNAEWHRGYDYDLKPLAGKACTAPEFDCTDCRVGPVATYTLLARLSERMRRSPEAYAALLELREQMMRFHFWDWGRSGEAGADTSSIAGNLAG